MLKYVLKAISSSSPEMRFQVLTAASMKMTVVWDVAPCSLVEIYQRFRGSYCRHHQDVLMMEAVRTSETSVIVSVCLHLQGQPWLWIHYVSPKRWYLWTSPHGVTAQKIIDVKIYNYILHVKSSVLSFPFKVPYYEGACTFACQNKVQVQKKLRCR
jgi:hypothetical protein